MSPQMCLQFEQTPNQKKASKIITGPCHPAVTHQLFQLLPSGRRFKNSSFYYRNIILKSSSQQQDIQYPCIYAACAEHAAADSSAHLATLNY